MPLTSQVNRAAVVFRLLVKHSSAINRLKTCTRLQLCSSNSRTFLSERIMRQHEHLDSSSRLHRHASWLWILAPLLAIGGYIIFSQALKEPSRKIHRVIIIGGGIAGLGAAHALSSDPNKRYSVMLLEAKDRLGGRIQTIWMPSKDGRGDSLNAAGSSPIDMGGMYFHGTDSDAMRFLQSLAPTVPSGGKSNLPGHGSAKWMYYQPSTASSADNQHESFAESDRKPGKWVELGTKDLQRGQQIYQQWAESIKQEFATYKQQYEASSEVNHLFETTQDICVSGPDHPPSKVRSTDLLLNWSNLFLNTLSIDDRQLVEFIKTMSFQLDRGVPLESLALNGVDDDWGWQDIGGTDHVTRFGMAQVVDVLAEQTDMIVHLSDRVIRIHYDTETGCRVETELNRSHVADACIVAIPIGVLKAESHKLFDPPLPRNKQRAIDRAGIAKFNTLAVVWKAPVCQSASNAYYHVGQAHRDNPLRFGFICSAQLRDSSDMNSITQFYFSGDAPGFESVQYWKEKALEVVRVQRPDLQLTDILEAYVSNWHTDRDFLGSYSAAIDGTKGNDDRRDLAEPVSDVVFFAGEHTHYIGRYQSIDGAFETGQRAASELVRMFV